LTPKKKRWAAEKKRLEKGKKKRDLSDPKNREKVRLERLRTERGEKGGGKAFRKKKKTKGTLPRRRASGGRFRTQGHGSLFAAKNRTSGGVALQKKRTSMATNAVPK